jgi:hypothetical protein
MTTRACHFQTFREVREIPIVREQLVTTRQPLSGIIDKQKDRHARLTQRYSQHVTGKHQRGLCANGSVSGRPDQSDIAPVQLTETMHDVRIDFRVVSFGEKRIQ